MNTNFQPEFGSRLNALLAECGSGVWIVSGVRSFAEQTVLWLRYLAGGHLAARPGTSNHERGLAADLGGDLDLAHRLSAKHGLYWPIKTEYWHIESNGKAVTAPPPKKRKATDMACEDKQTGGNWSVDETGAAFANDGAPFLGGLNGHQSDWKVDPGKNGYVAGIAPYKTGYVILFRFDGSAKPNTYHFTR